MRTRKPYKEIEWSKSSMVHNVYRVFEYAFGREKGIRIENRTVVNENKIALREFYTVESLLVFFESEIYRFINKPFGFVRDLKRIKVYAPAFSGYQPINPTGYIFAVAIDLTTTEGASSNSSPDTTNSHTVSGSDRGLVFFFNYGGAGTLTNASGITYNGDALTSEPGGGANAARFASSWSLIAPDTGANTAVVSWSGTKNEKSYAMISLTGVDQTDFVEVSEGTSVALTTDVTKSVTTLTDDSWLLVNFVERNGRALNLNVGTAEIYDVASDAAGVGITGGYNTGGTAGSYEVSWTPVGGTELGYILGLAIKPAAASPSQSARRGAVMMM